jgi:hypothetical protein
MSDKRRISRVYQIALHDCMMPGCRKLLRTAVWCLDKGKLGCRRSRIRPLEVTAENMISGQLATGVTMNKKGSCWKHTEQAGSSETISSGSSCATAAIEREAKTKKS